MSFSTEEKRAIDEIAALDHEKMIIRIKEISVASWDNALESLTVKSWLTNFTGEFFGNQAAEQNLALWILENYVYYTDRDVRAMAKNMWWKYLHHQLIRLESSNTLADKPIPEKIEYIKDETIIQPLGNCSGSGTNVAYCFRQTNRLKKERFDLLNAQDFKYLVLVDDATLSGHQAEENLAQFDKYIGKERFILTYISSMRAKEYLHEKVTLISSVDLDEKSRCFDSNSYVFRIHPNWTAIAKKMCEHYGQKLDPHNPVGFRKGQYTLGFHYNIPNNSLPIFWGTLGGWVPLFTRYFSDEPDGRNADDEAFF